MLGLSPRARNLSPSRQYVPVPTGRVVLIRHGETEWSRAWRHTGRTDLPLTRTGEAQARQLRAALDGRPFAAVVCSPLQRARRTAEVAGLAVTATDDDLVEWDYGDVEGITTADWQTAHPGWWLWRDGAPSGETLDDVAARAARALARLRPHLADGDVAVVSHGHLLRVLAAAWCELPPITAAHLRLDVACLSLLGFEHDTPVILRWNSPLRDPLD